MTHCTYCQRVVEKNHKDQRHRRSTDHVIPLSKGGKNTADNWVICCQRCNSIKGSMLPADWDAFKAENPNWRNLFPQHARKWEKSRKDTAS